MTLPLSAYLIVCPLVMLAALIDAVAGGGGLISLPAYLAAGLPLHLAAGSNKLSATIGAIFANFAYIRSGAMPWRPALFGVLGALPGSMLGARLLLLVQVDIIRPLLLVAVPVVAWLVLRAKDDAPAGEEQKNIQGWRQAAIPFGAGLIIGTYDGFFGPGTGTFLTLALRATMGLPWIKATAATKLINLSSGAGSLAVFMLNGQVAAPLALSASVFSIAGSLIGARLAVRHGGKLIRAMLIVALVLLLAKVLWDLLA